MESPILQLMKVKKILNTNLLGLMGWFLLGRQVWIINKALPQTHTFKIRIGTASRSS